MREIVVDTETTGLEAGQGHRIVEIGCVELKRSLPTGSEFHRYLNPDRDIPDIARQIHGIDDNFVKDKPRFADIADDLLIFFGDAKLVMHNAPFDMSFLNAELSRCAKPGLANDVCDTLLLAQDRFRGERVGLDALCRRYGIDLAVRERHGALIDARLLAKVYLELCGGRQQGIGFAEPAAPQPLSSRAPKAQQPSDPEQKQEKEQGKEQAQEERVSFRVLHASLEEKEAHRALLAKIKEKQE